MDFLGRFLIADLPECTDSPSRDGRAYVVTDPVDSEDATVGGGSARPHVVVCDGSAGFYVAIPGAPVAFSSARITRVAPQAIPDSTPTFISWDTTTFDDNGWSGAGGGTPTRVTFDFNGRVLCTLSVVGPTPPATENEVCVEAFINGLNVSPNPGCFSVAANEGNAATFADVFVVSTSDFLEIRVSQDTGADLDIEANLTCLRIL